MESLIIYGGSFDPIHNGHLRIARAASMMLNADVVFVPARTPRWKTPAATPKQRLEMLQLALKKDGSPAFFIDLFEMRSRAEYSYSIDLVRHMANKHKNRKLYLLIGADEVNSFPRWKDAEEIVKYVTPLYVSRPDVAIDDKVLSQFHMQRLPYEGSGPVSSTKVRNLVDLDIPLAIRDYIEKEGIYYMAKLKEMLTPHRLQHSVSVANLAYNVAMRNKLPDCRKAYSAGLLHDLGKNTDSDTAKKIMKEHFPEYVDYPSWTYHQFVGSYLAETVFGIKDPEILEAIKSHATGAAHMPPLSKIIYSTDKIDPLRGFDSRKLIDACFRNYYVGFMSVLSANRDYLFSKGYSVDNPLTKACFDLYLGEDQ
ncbi:MAG: nicotinate (nicotinamide) nucleotide adenylyltransferase [Bacilli bacterium]|nr:nicotinate (nicotinamide) nucleotide adenylyltransferase [Bacilli bacterium]MBO6286061.1 nicotinate (nicotinamide) nucleotide adenylyltransferase [Bacilli bacterium]